MAPQLRSIIIESLDLLLRPIVRLCLRSGITAKEFTTVTKGVFISVAEVELQRSGVAPSFSRISVMTGIQRRDVGVYRMLSAGSARFNTSLISRVIGQWTGDKRFLDSNGRPRKLSVSGKSCEFAKLVRKVSTDPNHYVVLFEMERAGLVEKNGDFATLLTSAYVPKGNPGEALRILGRDIHDIVESVSHNIGAAEADLHLHARTEYDNIPIEELPAIREWLHKLGRKVHSQARRFLSQFDRDINPRRKVGTGRARVSLGMFSFSEELKLPGSDKKEGDI